MKGVMKSTVHKNGKPITTDVEVDHNSSDVLDINHSCDIVFDMNMLNNDFIDAVVDHLSKTYDVVVVEGTDETPRHIHFKSFKKKTAME